MSYLQKSKRPGEKAGFYASIGITAFLLLFGLIFPHASSRAVQSIISPFWREGNVIEEKLGDWLSPFYFKRTLADENAALQKQVAGLQGDMLDYRRLQSENEALNAELGRKPKQESHIAAVVLASPELPYDTLILDAGTGAGISAGDAVVGGDGVYLGVISEVYGQSSKAVLASSPGIETKASVGGSPITFKGKGGGDYEALIPQNIPVAVGDAISAFKGQWNLATVADVELDPNNAFRRVLAHSPANFMQIRYVFIISQPTL